MPDSTSSPHLLKTQQYAEIANSLKGLLAGESDVIAILSSAAALVYHSLPEVNWAGFYRVCAQGLVLGPFQGKPACIRIAHGQGVCGRALTDEAIVLVQDTTCFPGHIACDPVSKSEIVLPVRPGNTQVLALLDIDSPVKNRFDEDDRDGLSRLVHLLEDALNPAGFPPAL